MVRWCGPPENGARSRSTACPVYTEIFIGRANRKWADRFVARAKGTFSNCTWSVRGCRQCKRTRYKSERKKKRKKKMGERERRKSNAETALQFQSCADYRYRITSSEIISAMCTQFFITALSLWVWICFLLYGAPQKLSRYQWRNIIVPYKLLLHKIIVAYSFPVGYKFSEITYLSLNKSIYRYWYVQLTYAKQTLMDSLFRQSSFDDVTYTRI